MTAEEYLKKTYKPDNYNIRPRAICVDGFSVSIQGGTTGHYCLPREQCDFYLKVELGFPSEAIPELKEYAEDENTTETVYGYVPIEELEEVIEKHGGIDYEKSIAKKLNPTNEER